MKYIYYTRDDCNPFIWRWNVKHSTMEMWSLTDNEWTYSGCHPSMFCTRLNGHRFASLIAARIFVEP